MQKLVHKAMRGLIYSTGAILQQLMGLLARNCMPLYRWEVRRLHQILGIDNYARMPLQTLATRLVRVDGVLMTPVTGEHWQRMRDAAAAQGVILRVSSGYRDLPDQVHMLRRFMQNSTLAEALKRVAAPGHSEHHTGRALDIGTTECFPPKPGFERTEAYRWLVANAQRFGFILSYPENNRYGIMFEAWHWCHTRS
jgi:LAS superfamily LD-carboxypeptidase LdcB